MAYTVVVKKEDKVKAVKTKPVETVQVDLEGKEAVDKRQKLDRIETCIFQRSGGSKWERGLLLNEGDLGILDEYGKLVEAIFDFKVQSEFVLNICHTFEAMIL